MIGIIHLLNFHFSIKLSPKGINMPNSFTSILMICIVPVIFNRDSKLLILLSSGNQKILVFLSFALAFLSSTLLETEAQSQETECPPSSMDYSINYHPSDESCRAQAFCPDGELYDGYKCTQRPECPDGYEWRDKLILAMENIENILDEDAPHDKHSGIHFHKDIWCEPVKSCNDGSLNIFGDCERKPDCPKPTKMNVFGNCQAPVEKSCPEDTILNAFGNCEAKPSCEKGTLNVFGDCEIKPSCPSGSTAVLGICEKKADCDEKTLGVCTDYSCDKGWKQTVALCSKAPSCPKGMSMKGTVCVDSPKCPDRTSLNKIDVCIGDVENSCPFGLTPNVLGFCITEPTCWYGWSYDESSNKCIKTPDFPGEKILEPCPTYPIMEGGEKDWNNEQFWDKVGGKCMPQNPSCDKYNANGIGDSWWLTHDEFGGVFPDEECIMELCKNSKEKPTWIKDSQCDLQRNLSSNNNLDQLHEGIKESQSSKNSVNEIVEKTFSLEKYFFENPEKITSEEIYEIYQNDEQFRDWISENSPGTSIENVIEELNESYEILDDSSSEPDIDNTIKPDNNSANKPHTNVLPNTKLDKEIPEWIKDQSEWWISGAISDREFIDLFEYLIENEIINVPNLPEPEQVGKAPIPSWFKNNVRWWNTGQVTDFDFAKGLEHLVKIGVIVIQKN